MQLKDVNIGERVYVESWLPLLPDTPGKVIDKTDDRVTVLTDYGMEQDYHALTFCHPTPDATSTQE